MTSQCLSDCIGFLLEQRLRHFPKKAGAYRNNAGIASYYEKKPRSNSKGPSKNPRKDSSRWQTLPRNPSNVRKW